VPRGKRPKLVKRREWMTAARSEMPEASDSGSQARNFLVNEAKKVPLTQFILQFGLPFAVVVICPLCIQLYVPPYKVVLYNYSCYLFYQLLMYAFMK
jgi:hypothetical protein